MALNQASKIVPGEFRSLKMRSRCAYDKTTPHLSSVPLNQAVDADR